MTETYKQARANVSKDMREFQTCVDSIPKTVFGIEGRLEQINDADITKSSPETFFKVYLREILCSEKEMVTVKINGVKQVFFRHVLSNTMFGLLGQSLKMAGGIQMFWSAVESMRERYDALQIIKMYEFQPEVDKLNKLILEKKDYHLHLYVRGKKRMDYLFKNITKECIKEENRRIRNSK